MNTKTNIRTFASLHSKMVLGAVVVLASLLSSACQTPPPLDVKSVTRNVDFNQYRSINVQSLNDSERKIIGYIDNAMKANLREKGYDIAEQADLILAYQVAVDNSQRIDLKQVNTVKGVYSIPKLEPVNQASVLINAYDAKTGQVVWKASTIRDITHVNPKGVDQERINQRVEELLETFPGLKNSSSLFY